MEEVARCNTQGRVQACPQRSRQQGTLVSEVLSSSGPSLSSDYVYETQNNIWINTKNKCTKVTKIALIKEIKQTKK